jgi:hypothetical protein
LLKIDFLHTKNKITNYLKMNNNNNDVDDDVNEKTPEKNSDDGENEFQCPPLKKFLTKGNNPMREHLKQLRALDEVPRARRVLQFGNFQNKLEEVI